MFKNTINDLDRISPDGGAMEVVFRGHGHAECSDGVFITYIKTSSRRISPVRPWDKSSSDRLEAPEMVVSSRSVRRTLHGRNRRRSAATW